MQATDMPHPLTILLVKTTLLEYVIQSKPYQSTDTIRQKTHKPSRAQSFSMRVVIKLESTLGNHF